MPSSPERGRAPADRLGGRFASDRRGNIAFAAAIFCVPIMLAAGLSLDAVKMTQMRTDLQSSLDASAMEVARKVTSGLTQAQLEEAGRSFFLANLTTNHPGLTGSGFRYLGMSSDGSGLQSVSFEADLAYDYMVPRSIGGHEGGTSTSILVTSQISSTIGDNACIYALHESASRAIEAAGNTDVAVDGCVIASNSTASDSIYVGGSAKLTADCLQSSGEIVADGGLVTDCAESREHAWRLPDPFADLSEPVPPMLMANPKKADTVVAPGRYRNLDLDGTKRLNAGLYYVEGSLSIKGTITGAGVTIFMATGGISINASASLSLSAPTEGPYAGMLFWSARSNQSAHLFNGNGVTDLNGYLYFPSSSLSYSGNNGTTSTCLRMVASTITMTGSSTLRTDCSEELGGREAKVSGPFFYSR